MRISKAATASGCHLETIRYYERIGLVPAPARTRSGYRSYGEDAVDRLRFVTRGRELGFSLEEIGSLLHLSESSDLPCAEVDQLARRHLEDIRAKLKDLRRMAAELERVIGSCSGGERAECTILGTLSQKVGSAKT